MFNINRSFGRVAAAGLSIALVLATGLPAQAGKPEVINFDNSFMDDLSCSFPINVRLSGTFRVKQIGNVNQSVFNFEITTTNPANGKLATAKSHGSDFEKLGDDGYITFTTVGGATFIVRGQGSVGANFGRIVWRYPADFSTPPEVIFDAGPSPRGQVSDVCPYLAD